MAEHPYTSEGWARPGSAGSSPRFPLAFFIPSSLSIPGSPPPPPPPPSQGVSHASPPAADAWDPPLPPPPTTRRFPSPTSAYNAASSPNPRSLDAPMAAAAAACVESPDEGVEIREVWAGNLEAEIAAIRDEVDRYPYVAMDTEFPGIVCRPVGNFRTTDEFNYANLEANVNMLKLIQLGLTLSDEGGDLPRRGTGGRRCIWQFNFRGFDPRTDPSNADSIQMLRTCGIDFDRFAAEGADPIRFAELLMSSGVVLNADVQWITFHSGYDFGYLLRLLTGRNLPDNMPAFFDLIRIYFPVLYDIKHLMRFCSNLHGGLSRLGELLDVKRVGTCHQAGSDSLLTLGCYNKIKEVYFKGSTEKHAGVLYGLVIEDGVNRPPPTQPNE